MGQKILNILIIDSLVDGNIIKKTQSCSSDNENAA